MKEISKEQFEAYKNASEHNIWVKTYADLGIFNDENLVRQQVERKFLNGHKLVEIVFQKKVESFPVNESVATYDSTNKDQVLSIERSRYFVLNNADSTQKDARRKGEYYHDTRKDAQRPVAELGKDHFHA